MADTTTGVTRSMLVSELQNLLRLTAFEQTIATVRRTQAASPAIAEELRVNAQKAVERSRLLQDAVRQAGGVPDVVGAALGRAGALLQTQVNQVQTLQGALLGDLALEHQLRERTRYARTLADSLGYTQVIPALERLETAHSATIQWLEARLDEVGRTGTSALRATPIQAAVGSFRKVAGVPFAVFAASVNRSSSLLHRGTRTAVSTAEGAAQTAAQTAGSAAQAAGSAASAAAERTSDAAQTAADAAGKAVTTAAGTVSETAGSAAGTVSQTADKAADVTAQTADKAAGAAAQTADKAAGAAAQTADKAADVTAQTADKAADVTAQTADKAADVTAQTADKAADVTAQTADKAADVTAQTADKAAGAAAQTADKAADAAESATEQAVDVSDVDEQKAPFAGYESLSGDSVMRHVRDSDDVEHLREILAFEQAHKARKGVLGALNDRLTELSGPSSSA